MNKHLENFCWVKQIAYLKGPVDLICSHHFSGKLRKLHKWETEILSHVSSEHTPEFYNMLQHQRIESKRDNLM